MARLLSILTFLMLAAFGTAMPNQKRQTTVGNTGAGTPATTTGVAPKETISTRIAATPSPGGSDGPVSIVTSSDFNGVTCACPLNEPNCDCSSLSSGVTTAVGTTTSASGTSGVTTAIGTTSKPLVCACPANNTSCACISPSTSASLVSTTSQPTMVPNSGADKVYTGASMALMAAVAGLFAAV